VTATYYIYIFIHHQDGDTVVRICTSVTLFVCL